MAWNTQNTAHVPTIPLIKSSFLLIPQVDILLRIIMSLVTKRLNIDLKKTSSAVGNWPLSCFMQTVMRLKAKALPIKQIIPSFFLSSLLKLFNLLEYSFFS